MKLFSVEELQNIFNSELEKSISQLTGKEPVKLYQPVEYALEMGGKRIRPLLLMIGFNLFSDEIENAIPAALAIEVFHNFTLLHDDIMDKADIRRNRPTVHRKFSENSAILSGDVMAFLAYRNLLACNSLNLPELLDLFTKTAIEVCEGQQLDMDFEHRLTVSEDEYLEMIRLKTAVLLACSLKAGALTANAGTEVADKLYEMGINLGLAFQLQDDLLDTFGDAQVFGKKIGGDIEANKKTFLLIKALENGSAEQKHELENWVSKPDFIAEEKIVEVKSIFNQLNISEITQNKIDFYFNRCATLFNQIEVQGTRKGLLKNIISGMLKREF